MSRDTGFYFSPKQREVMSWWYSPGTRDLDGIICHGAVRSGKTMILALSFLMWSMATFSGRCFGICGKTIVSVRRNLLGELWQRAESLGFHIQENKAHNYLDITLGHRTNRYYLFGGRDESSAALIQGMTLAGVLMDEAAIMPRSFLEQAVARCSVAGSRLFFSCNPENPYNFFKTEWIDKAAQKRLLVLHFTLEDNPSLTREVIDRYSRLYTGSFYRRFVLGEWAAAEGLVYPMFDSLTHTFTGLPPGECERYIVSCDYGTVNPSSFGLWGRLGEKWYRLDEYYYDSGREGRRRTDEEHYQGLCRLIGERDIEYVVCDPSAASFIQCISRHGRFPVRTANNDVVYGIRRVSDMLREGRILINRGCRDILREFALYRWDEKAGRDCPVKEHDHAMDDLRYFVTSLDDTGEGFTVMTVSRR